MPLTRNQIGRLYRPAGVKPIALGLAWSSGGRQLIGGPQIDLSVPLRGFRFEFRLRDVIGTANMTSANPLGYLNLISRIVVTGVNRRIGGNVTLWDIDLPSLILFQSVFSTKKPFSYNGVNSTGGPSAGTELLFEQPSTPIAGFFAGTTGTYDIRIVFDLPAYPPGTAPFLRAGYNLRAQEWRDSLQIQLQFPTITNGTTHALGTDAATTTHTFTAFGSSSGSPTIDVYALPSLLGPDLDAQIVPGVVSRVAVPVTTTLQSAGGANTKLLTLEKQNTTRIVAIVGTSSVTPHFTSLTDNNLTTAGVIVGGNRVVRENVSIHVHKREVAEVYNTQPILGVIPFDFMQSGNPDAAYEASSASEGTTFEVRGTVAGAANALGIFVQEMELAKPGGALYSA